MADYPTGPRRKVTAPTQEQIRAAIAANDAAARSSSSASDVARTRAMVDVPHDPDNEPTVLGAVHNLRAMKARSKRADRDD